MCVCVYQRVIFRGDDSHDEVNNTIQYEDNKKMYTLNKQKMGKNAKNVEEFQYKLA